LSSGQLRYRPIPVKEILKRMKNICELMIDLSACSLIFYDERVVKEVYRLEEEMDQLEAQLIMHAALATRNPEDAERMLSVYNLAISMDYISDAASDIARLAERGARLRAGREFFASSPTRIVHVLPIGKGSPYVNKRIVDIYRELGGIFDVIALKRGDRYIFEPGEGERILEGDVMYVKGTVEAVERLIRRCGEPEREITQFEEGLLDSLLQLKEISELMVDLAYSAMITGSGEIVDEIFEMENYVDEMAEELRDRVLRSGEMSVEEKVAMIGLADAYEEIADAAVNIVYGLEKGLEPHPIISDVIDETLERYTTIRVAGRLAGRRLSDLGLSQKGIIVLAVRRGREWIITPPYSAVRLRPGDMLIVKYHSEAEEEVRRLKQGAGG